MVRLLSLLDNDFYKFTMQQCVLKIFPRAKARYQFINRGKHLFPPGFAEDLRLSVENMRSLCLSKDEKRFLSTNCPYLDPVYLDFLHGYQYNPEEVIVEQRGSELDVSVEGPWYRTILWEVPLLSLICENYYQMLPESRIEDDAVYERAKQKMDSYNKLGVTIAEFGTRRRHSYAVQNIVVKALKENGGASFVGSSNVHLAHLHQCKPIGTHAHEWFMFHAAKYGYKMANSIALEHWVEVYRGDLGIALSDTFTTEEFFTQFDKKFAKLFDGVRHDSGDPLDFADKTIRHYQSMGIDPTTKTITFSDSLDYEKVARIAAHCNGRIGMSFGIGTNFSNDVGLKPMNIVMKMTEAKPEGTMWTPTVKLSDEKGKYSGDPDTIALAKKVLGIKN
ncbi:MAG: nicotinate phosphoribosyltransferase [Chitinophagaceae bacterium]